MMHASQQPGSSPHTHTGRSTARVMQLVLLATLPGIAALVFYFGWGVLINLLLASLTAIVAEAAILKLRQKPVGFYLKDYSALVTAVLLAVALPPLAPWWLVVTGTLFAIVIAKHLYGGLGYNPFNPAMVGYVVLLISFPVEMTRWLTPATILDSGANLPGLSQSLALVFTSSPALDGLWDGISGATPLDLFKHNSGQLVEQFYQGEVLFSEGRWAGVGWEWVNLGFLAGGIFLLWQRIFTWHAPVAMLAMLLLLALIFHDGGSSHSLGSPALHLLSGATMLGAFFIVTDPVTSATSNFGRLIYGALIGLLVYIIRAWGSYPDAVAFAVLLANFAAPFVDYYTLPRSYGHERRRRATEQQE
ncbi:electron transport complex subunit RsxD [Porticoccus sp. W117]|uniref:electron transport complex subunit RsxD n=1 Tax=Porticoccus sp. W117 TaxID=3054777 RepID=UPI002596F187|nr:electron transport complex subunit RsxD [Porticoccus sp. W117]MDM3870956.1 electron transport complex subunit RsxD [Porticoccus sp. W117]